MNTTSTRSTRGLVALAFVFLLLMLPGAAADLAGPPGQGSVGGDQANFGWDDPGDEPEWWEELIEHFDRQTRLLQSNLGLLWRITLNPGAPSTIQATRIVGLTPIQQLGGGGPGGSGLNATFMAMSSQPLLVHFTDKSTGSIVSWLWHFGDGTSSALQNPTHVYASAGTYFVSLRVTDIDGNWALGGGTIAVP